MSCRLALSLVAALSVASPAIAQSGSLQDAAYDLATIEADHEVCGFPLSDEQEDVIAQRRDAMVTRGDMSEADIASLREQVKAAARRQKDEGLCRPNGPEAQAYKRRITSLGLL